MLGKQPEAVEELVETDGQADGPEMWEGGSEEGSLTWRRRLMEIRSDGNSRSCTQTQVRGWKHYSYKQIG